MPDITSNVPSAISHMISVLGCSSGPRCANISQKKGQPRSDESLWRVRCDVALDGCDSLCVDHCMMTYIVGPSFAYPQKCGCECFHNEKFAPLDSEISMLH